MEGSVPEAKYQKLASEYSKLRAQAQVLKKAVLDEQAKEAILREQLQQNATSLRRTEQEVDSLGFRNKQLESRVSQLQQELTLHEQAPKKKDPSRRGLLGGSKQEPPSEAPNTNAAQEALIFEELQKKIMENAQLTSLIDDKQRDLLLHTERILELEQKLEKRISDQNEVEKRLRKEVETLQHRNCELETKLVDAASMLGSEDALSATGSDSTPLHNPLQQHQHQLNTNTALPLTAEERIALLEKETAHWRAQYEVLKLNQNQNYNFNSNTNNMDLGKTLSDASIICSCSTAAAGVTVKPCSLEIKCSQRARDSLQEPLEPPTKEQLIYSVFSKKFEDLLRLKALAESRLRSSEQEAVHLQICLENATQELKSKDEQQSSLGGALQMLEEELTTTRINYEEQISVLTEQVISLSEQLAAGH
ncbi:protein phosphatase 1 regulatory subunit 21 [Drosophila innubila]|uniref:protein phosphatase 1 regulatory subunit 21 n=1 Tax=Drosophila innubila TaxID=198719 RepID=UPI00148D227E|nr:protein phosphatase 1 regulatory subunit 21 [Drosophila innubila]XP_034487189.1 protein phosphatase 1 regulatory subunit 21 [Drosophila innubila]